MKPCECDNAIDLMVHLGARHAAEMHRRHAANSPTSFAAIDWAIHMAEEDVLLFPLFEKRFPRETAILYDDHVAFRADIRRYGFIRDVARVARHSRMEDELSLLLLGRK